MTASRGADGDRDPREQQSGAPVMNVTTGAKRLTFRPHLRLEHRQIGWSGAPSIPDRQETTIGHEDEFEAVPVEPAGHGDTGAAGLATDHEMLVGVLEYIPACRRAQQRTRPSIAGNPSPTATADNSDAVCSQSGSCSTYQILVPHLSSSSRCGPSGQFRARAPCLGFVERDASRVEDESQAPLGELGGTEHLVSQIPLPGGAAHTDHDDVVSRCGVGHPRYLRFRLPGRAHERRIRVR